MYLLSMPILIDEFEANILLHSALRLRIVHDFIKINAPLLT